MPAQDNWKLYEWALLSLVCWREARGEGYDGMLAVAYSLLDRVRRPSWWGTTIAQVIAKPWQYSSFTDPKDPQLIKFPKQPDASFEQAMQAASDAMNGVIPNPVVGADSYYDISIAAPQWATDENFVAAVGRLRFHNTDGKGA